jgi:hypothetical protein
MPTTTTAPRDRTTTIMPMTTETVVGATAVVGTGSNSNKCNSANTMMTGRLAAICNSSSILIIQEQLLGTAVA